MDKLLFLYLLVVTLTKRNPAHLSTDAKLVATGKAHKWKKVIRRTVNRVDQ